MTSFRRAGARRGGAAALTAQWAVNSQSGEQFIIATGGFSRDTVASVPTTFLLLFSSTEKRRYSTQSGTPVPTITLSVAVNRATSPEGRGFKTAYHTHQKSVTHLPYQSENIPYTRTNKPNLKAPFRKGGWHRR